MLREDIPAPEPTFGYPLLADTLLSLLREERKGAFVLGLHGPWGAGKTTLMQAIETRIKRDPTNIVVPFNAWKYHDREALWRALIVQVLEVLRSEKLASPEEIDNLQRSLYASFTTRESGQLRVDWTAAATEAILLAMRIGSANLLPGVLDRVGDWLNRLFNRRPDANDAKPEDAAKSIERVGKILTREITEKQVQQVVSIEMFLRNFKELVSKLDSKRPLYVLVDDLDRCLPEAALQVFEAIKLFMDAPECVYIIALDRDVIRRGLALRYAEAGPGGVDADEYIEKTISLSFDLPPLSISEACGLLRDCAVDVPLETADLERVVDLLGTNPRRLKRIGRSLSLLFAIARAVPEPAAPAPWPARPADRGLFLKLSLLGYRNSGVFGLLVRDAGLPWRLQQAANTFVSRTQEQGEGIALAELQKAMGAEHAIVRQAAADAVFWRILAAPPVFPNTPGRVATALRWYSAGELNSAPDEVSAKR
jgi:hypothetical protein